MGVYQFTDAEYAVIMDSLAFQRAEIRRLNPDVSATPNIDSAITKMNHWASPMGCEFVVATGKDAVFIMTTSD